MKPMSRHGTFNKRASRPAATREEKESKDQYPVYHDFCALTLKQVENLVNAADQNRYRGGKKSTFPKALSELLMNAETHGYDDIIAWQTHGRSFVVKDKKRFAQEVLPYHFGCQSSFASFQRQLNVYGFLRMTKDGPDRKSYYHELFLRGREDLLPLIPRKRNTTASVRRSLDPTTEPNLYKYPPSVASPPSLATTTPENTSSLTTTTEKKTIKEPTKSTVPAAAAATTTSKKKKRQTKKTEESKSLPKTIQSSKTNPEIVLRNTTPIPSINVEDLPSIHTGFIATTSSSSNSSCTSTGDHSPVPISPPIFSMPSWPSPAFPLLATATMTTWDLHHHRITPALWHDEEECFDAAAGDMIDFLNEADLDQFQ